MLGYYSERPPIQRLLLLHRISVGSGTFHIVKGTSPLTLSNAKKSKLKSLIQFGKVSVSGSDITCNNGVLSAGELTKNLCPLASGTDLNGDNCYTLSSSWAYDITGLDTTKDYTFSLYVADEYATATNHRIYVQGDTSGYISTSQGVGTFSRTLKPDENGVITIAHNKAALNTTEYAEGLQKFMLNEGESALPYEPYQYGIKTTGTPEAITLTDEDSNTQTATAPNLYAVDDITDEVDIISGKLTHRTQAVISDGTTPSGRYVGTVGEGNVIVEALEEKKTGTLVSFTEEKARKLNGVIAEFSPVQDLHGYDNPWPAGGGKNKFDPSAMPSPASSIQYHAFYVGDGTWTASTDAPYGDGNATVFFLAGDVSSGASTSTNGVSPSTGRTQTAVNGYVTVAWRTYSNIDPSQYHIQIESGSTISQWTSYSNECPIDGWDEVDVNRAAGNLIDESSLATADIIYSNGELVGTALKFHQTYGTAAKAIRIPQKGTNPVTISFEAYSEGNVSTTGNGLFTTFYYEDGTNTAQGIPNSTTEYTQFSLSSTDGKKLVGLSFGYGSNGGNIWHVRKMMLNSGSTALPFVPYHGELVPVQFRTDTVNQWDEEWEVGTIDSSTGIDRASTTQIRCKGYIPVIAGEKYYFNLAGTSYLIWYNSNKQRITNVVSYGPSVRTIADGVCYVRFSMASAYGTTYNHDISINYPSSETSYHPYLTTVYGGYLRINRDGSVDAVAERGIGIYDGSEDESWSLYNAYNGFYIRNASMKTGTSQSGHANWLSVGGFGSSKRVVLGSGNNDYMYIIHITDNIADVTDLATWKDYLSGNPLQIDYPLAVPVVYHLTPVSPLKTLAGVNNWWSTANGDITLYVAQDEVVEQVTPQPLTVEWGTNTVSWTAEVDGKEMEAKYKAEEGE